MQKLLKFQTSDSVFLMLHRLLGLPWFGGDQFVQTQWGIHIIDSHLLIAYVVNYTNYTI